MPLNPDVGGALSPVNLLLPPAPRVVRIDPEDYVDADGEDALRVVVVLGNETTDDQLLSDSMGQIQRAIRDALHDRGITKFPYIHFATEAELAAHEVED